MTPAEQADIELQHILLELRAGRSNHMRHFIDSWFCFTHGYVRPRGGAANWDAIVFSEYVSEGAAKLGKGASYGEITRDHVVPLRVVRRLLSDLKGRNLNKARIRKILEVFVHHATITAEENRELTRRGLRDAMPDDWDRKDAFARYRAVGIKTTKIA